MLVWDCSGTGLSKGKLIKTRKSSRFLALKIKPQRSRQAWEFSNTPHPSPHKQSFVIIWSVSLKPGFVLGWFWNHSFCCVNNLLCTSYSRFSNVCMIYVKIFITNTIKCALSWTSVTTRKVKKLTAIRTKRKLVIINCINEKKASSTNSPRRVSSKGNRTLFKTVGAYLNFALWNLSPTQQPSWNHELCENIARKWQKEGNSDK